MRLPLTAVSKLGLSAIALMFTVTASGCGIVGTWESSQSAESAPEEGVQYAPRRVEFRDDGTYAATVTYDGKETTNQGRYAWTGRRLIITPRGRRSRTYTGLHWRDRLYLKTDYRGKTIRCTLSRIPE